MSGTPAKGALSGLRIIDLATVWAGPFATTILADMGAEVIQVESLYRYPTGGKGQANPKKELVPKLGNLMRGYPDLDPGPDSWNRSSIFNAHARNKRNMTVDLTRDRGRELFMRLVDISDALIENNPVGTLEKLGVGHEALLERNPRLVVVRMPPLGSDGPDAKVTGLGSQFEGFIGISHIQGYPDEDAPVASLHMDAASGPAAASALLMGIIRRRRTGRGGLVEVPQAENLVHHHGETFVAAGMHGTEPERLGNRHHRWAPQGVYPTSDDDGWIALSVRNDVEWQALVETMGAPGWASDPALAHESGRREAHDLIDKQLAEWTSGHDKYELFHRLQQAGVPAGPVMTEADAYQDPHLRERGFFVELEHPRAGTHDHPGRLFDMSLTPPQLRRAAPVLGHDNRYVYQELLGIDDDEYRDLEADGHIGDHYIFG